MFAKPQAEHAWLDQLIGDWTFDHDCQMPDGNTSTASGNMTCRSLGGLWLVCESSGDAPDSGPWSSIMTLGFDPVKDQYVGTFVGSMMANLWLYHGILDANQKRLVLETLGPSFDGSGTCNYRDTIEITDGDHWLMTSSLQADDGEWVPFMTGKHTRG
ncbi:hypothetical protein Enr13x_01710 [Stieleria neptunia]|uniref:DUF1579 domain-containing protein n=1 Tax=Stieleria neptunia TaxID=2527979 RepID=A0A518HHP1_9BACT|nr:DUF1579 domain-containing protein [Stieleria neptunia]QDV40365.1 hypothetical protein Enr13x_01710 [Stieleria neptunia]